MAIKDYLVVDIEKPVATFADLTNYFQGRVGDAKAYCKLWIKSGSNSVDMSNKKMRFYGKDSNATPFVAAGGFDDDQPGDDRQLGLITFYFPDGIFQKEGKWQEAFFKIQDENGSDISTINLTLNVLPNQIEMGISVRPFIPELEKTRAKVNQALREMNAQQLLNQLNSMKTTVGAYTDLIEQHAVLNKPQTVDLINSIFNPFRTEVNGDLSNLKNNVTDQLNNMQSSVNDTLSKSEWKSLVNNATMLNGCGGWVAGQLFYNNTIAVGRVFGYVELPANNPMVDFSTNPFASTMDWSNNTVGQVVVLWPNNNTGQRPLGSIGLEPDKSTFGLFGTAVTTIPDAYHILFSMPFTTYRSALNV